MFTETTLKKFSIDEENNSIGKVEVNIDILKNEKFYYPFIRENTNQEIIRYGNRDYQEFEQFIITSLNDYYTRLMKSSGIEYNNMLKIYERLYEMWQDLYNFKLSKNIEEINKIYDVFSYELYLLGFTNI